MTNPRPLLPGLLLPALAVLAACAPVPKPPADLLEVVDLGTLPVTRDPEAARELLAAADRAWDLRDDLEQAIAARRDYGRAAAADPTLYDAYWKAARASAAIGQRLDRDAERAAEFERGAGIARLGIPLAPERAEGHYFYGVTLGLWARERKSIGLASVKEIIPHFETAAEIAPDLEHAGPFRSLALVYLRAPAWPTSVGDEEVGLEWARRAVAQSPDYPGNHLCLAEALEALGEREEAREAAERAVDLAGSGPWTGVERADFLAEAERLRKKLR